MGDGVGLNLIDISFKGFSMIELGWTINKITNNILLREVLYITKV